MNREVGGGRQGCFPNRYQHTKRLGFSSEVKHDESHECHDHELQDRGNSYQFTSEIMFTSDIMQVSCFAC